MLGDYLKRHRISANLTQSQMAERLHTSQGYYSQIEAGRKKPGFRMVGRIAKALGVDPSEIREML